MAYDAEYQKKYFENELNKEIHMLRTMISQYRRSNNVARLRECEKRLKPLLEKKAQEDLAKKLAKFGKEV